MGAAGSIQDNGVPYFCHPCSIHFTVQNPEDIPVEGVSCPQCRDFFVEQRELPPHMRPDPGGAGGGRRASQRVNAQDALRSIGGIEGLVRLMGAVGSEGQGDIAQALRASFEQQEGAAEQAQPTPQTLVDSLPFVKATAVGEDGHSEECAVCQEAYAAGEMLMALPCKHSFHPECIVPWLKTHSTCPICRAVVNEESVGDRLPSRRTRAERAEEYQVRDPSQSRARALTPAYTLRLRTAATNHTLTTAV